MYISAISKHDIGMIDKLLHELSTRESGAITGVELCEFMPDEEQNQRIINILTKYDAIKPVKVGITKGQSIAIIIEKGGGNYLYSLEKKEHKKAKIADKVPILSVIEKSLSIISLVISIISIIISTKACNKAEQTIDKQQINDAHIAPSVCIDKQDRS